MGKQHGHYSCKEDDGMGSACWSRESAALDVWRAECSLGMAAAGCSTRVPTELLELCICVARHVLTAAHSAVNVPAQHCLLCLHNPAVVSAKPAREVFNSVSAEAT